MTSRQGSQRRTTTHFESLEQRRLLSVTYTTVDLARLVSHAATDSFQPVGITNTGLIAFNDLPADEVGAQAGYVYALSGHRLYAGPSGSVIEAITDNGGDAYSTEEGTVINFDGQTHTIFNPPESGPDDQESFGVTSMNSAGDVAGTLYDDDDIPGDGTTSYEVEVYNASASQITTPNDFSGYFNSGIPPVINNAGQMLAFRLVDNNGGGFGIDDAVVYNLSTQTAMDITPMFKSGTTVKGADINQNGIVVGNYQRGRSVGGIFEFDTANNALTLIPNAAGEVFTADAISDNRTIVGQVQSAVRARNHVRTVTHAATFTTDGTVTDLDTQSAPPTGVTLTLATGVNTNGDILAEGTDASGVQHVYLLEPNG